MTDTASCLTSGPPLRPKPERVAQRNKDLQTSSTSSTTTAFSSAPGPLSHHINIISTSDETSRPIGRDEGRRASKKRSVEVVAEAKGDVHTFMDELEQKRRQLDEQIHKYIAQKEREYKLYERELRTKYRSPGTATEDATGLHEPHKASQGTAQRDPMGRTDWPRGAVAEDADQESRNVNAGRSVVKPDLAEARSSSEREKELLGLFTPAFLPLLDSKSPELNRSPSAPLLREISDTNALEPDRNALHRASTEPLLEAGVPKRSERLGLTQRTPSSGSDPGRPLVSALKSSNTNPNLPKRKRVSIKLDVGAGVEVVHPSDSVPAMGNYTSMHHSEGVHRQATIQQTAEAEPPSKPVSVQVSRPIPEPKQSGLRLGLMSQPDRATHIPASSEALNEEPNVSASPFAMDEEMINGWNTERRPKESEEDDLELDLSPEPSPPSRFPELSPTLTGSPDSKPAPSSEPFGQTEAPFGSFRSPSSSFTQPTSPGFSRPSVTQDPEFPFPAERSVETPSKNSFYGSFTRPTAARQVSSSLGESYMQRNAAKMMQRRKSDEKR